MITSLAPKRTPPSKSKALASAETRIAQFVEAYMTDESGLLYSHLHAETLKPWTNELMQGFCLQHMYKNHPRPEQNLSYEDSLMATGEYACAQIARFQATAEPLALVTAARAVGAITQVQYQGSHHMPGHLPKPFGGVRGARDSHEISPDQYVKSVVAMRAFQPYAPEAMKATIDRYLVDIADYFVARDFVHHHRENKIVSPESRVHCIALYIPLLHLAANITGDQGYLDHLDRFDSALDRVLVDAELANDNILSLFLEGFHLAIQEGATDPRLKLGIRRIWEITAETVLENGLIHRTPGGTAHTSRSLLLAARATIVEQYHPEVDAISLAWKLLDQQQDPREMKYVISEGDEAIHAMVPIDFRSICETSVTSWLLAYWRLVCREKMSGGPSLPADRLRDHAA